MKLRIGGLLFFLAVVLLGTWLMFGKAISQGIGAAVSIMYNGNYVSSTNALPVAVPTVSPGLGPPAGICTGGAGCLPPVGDTGFTQAVTSSLVQFIAAPVAGSVRITAIQALVLDSASGGSVTLIYGTGTNCATSGHTLAIIGVSNTTVAANNAGTFWGSGVGAILIVPALNAVCVQGTPTISAGQIAGTYTVY